MGDKDYFDRACTLPFFDSIAWTARRRIYDIFVETMAPDPGERIVDVGVFAGSEDPNQNFLELLYPYPAQITAVGIEDASFLERQYPGLRFRKITADEPLPFTDDEFAVGFSSAVLEHVGDRVRQRFYLEELLRVSRRIFLVTPNRYYPVEFHTRLPLAHWLPPAAFRAILRVLGLAFYACEQNLNLLSRRELLELVPVAYRDRARIRTFKLLGMPANLILVVNK